MLFASLQCQTVGRVAVHVDTDSDQAAWQRAFVFVATGHVSGVRAAVAQGHTKALGRADHDVGISRRARCASPLPWGCQQRQRQQIGGNDKGRLFAVHQRHVGTQAAQMVWKAAIGRGVLRQHRKVVASQSGLPLGG